MIAEALAGEALGGSTAGDAGPDAASSRGGPRSTPLTRREEEVARRIADGLTNRQIAAELGLSERTIDAHLRNIMSKLGVNSRAQVAAWIASQGAMPDR